MRHLRIGATSLPGALAKVLIISALTGLAVLSAAVAAAEDTDDDGATAQIETLPVQGSVQMIAGAGANVAVQSGNDGTVVVNAGNAQQAQQLLATIRKLTAQPIRYVIDTSGDANVVGGNAVLGQAGRNIYATGVAPIRMNGNAELAATILASPGVVFKVSAPTGQTSPYPREGWPTLTFETNNYYIYFNHEAVQLYRQAAHDNTDAIVFFRGSDVIAAGAIIDTDRFPVIDVKNGGSIQGEIAALNQILDLSDIPVPFIWERGGSYIIPGHGRLYQQADVLQYRDMMVEIAGVVQDMIKRHMTLQQVQAASPCLAFEGEYGRSSGPWTTQDFVRAVYESLRHAPGGAAVKTAEAN